LSIRLTTTLRNRPASARTAGKIIGENRFDGDAVEAVGEDFEGFMHDGVGIGGNKFGGGEADKLGKFVHQRGERGNFAFDQPRALLNQAG